MRWSTIRNLPPSWPASISTRRTPEERIPVGPQLSLAAWDSEPTTADTDFDPSPAVLLDGPLLDTLSDDRTVRVPLFVGEFAARPGGLRALRAKRRE